MHFKRYLLLLIIFSGCNRNPFGMFDDSTTIRVNRFDSVLFHWIDAGDSTSLQLLISDYPQMVGLLGKTLFQDTETDSAVFFEKLKNYYAQPALKTLYQDALTVYASHSPVMKRVEKEFSYGFMRLKELFPTIQVPAIYMHVSGLQQNLIVADSLLSLSIDKYLGGGYPLYENHFYPYERKGMTTECIVKDGLYAWLTTEYPCPDRERVLLDKMIYEGKMVYILSQAGYHYTLPQIMQLTENEYRWCVKNEAKLWKTLIERKLLSASDPMTLSRFFLSAPSSFISEDAPGNLGLFIGYRIVSGYMKQTQSTCKELIQNNNAQEILKKSKYKP